MRTPLLTLQALLALALPLGSSACVTEAPRHSVDAAKSSPDALPRPWPTDFEASAVLVAEEVRVEGPPGLISHFALRVDPEFHDRSEETTPAGYLQTVVTKPGSPVEIRAYLDQLEIAAFARLTMLERPGDCDIVVRASGDVYFTRTKGGEPQRSPTLQLVAKQPPGPR